MIVSPLNQVVKESFRNQMRMRRNINSHLLNDRVIDLATEVRGLGIHITSLQAHFYGYMAEIRTELRYLGKAWGVKDNSKDKIMSSLSRPWFEVSSAVKASDDYSDEDQIEGDNTWSAKKEISNSKNQNPSQHKSNGDKDKERIANPSVNITLDDAPSFDIGLTPSVYKSDALPMSVNPVTDLPNYEVGSSSGKMISNSNAVKGMSLFTLIADFDNEDPKNDIFETWLLDGVNKCRKGKIYVKDHDKIGTSLDFYVELVREKIWLYDLRTIRRCLT
ncbi:uncharacterized protein [Euphorbia lathyris]|uniref:uncharacterized protein isoform X2 n=1 Tax=Euphorbia lathyris TaxID=212925 RepID=UPI00331336A5